MPRAAPLVLLALMLAPPAAAQGWERTYTLTFSQCPDTTRHVYESELTRLHGYIQLRPDTCGPTRCRQSYVSTMAPNDLLNALRRMVEASGHRARISVEGLRYNVACLPGRRVAPREAAPAGPALTEYRAPCGTIFELGGEVLFGYDSARIRSEAVPALIRLAARIRETRPDAVEITGHTDSRGSRAYNRALSERRARSVARYLSATPGLSRQRFLLRGMGEAEPVAPNAFPDGRDNPAGRQANRRVEVVLRDRAPGCPDPRGRGRPLDPSRW